MVPKTPSEMESLIFMAVMSRAYGSITREARRRRLTEHDISMIERKALDIGSDGSEFAHEFETFEVEPAVAKALNTAKQFFATMRNARAKDIQKP